MLKTLNPAKIVTAEAPVIDPVSPTGKRSEDREGEPTAVGLVNGTVKAANRVTNMQYDVLHSLSDRESQALPHCKSVSMFSWPGSSAGSKPTVLCWTWRVFRAEVTLSPKLVDTMSKQYTRLFEQIVMNDTPAQAKALIDSALHSVSMSGRASVEIPGGRIPKALAAQSLEFSDLHLPAVLFCTVSPTVSVSGDEADALLSSRSIGSIRVRHSDVTVKVAKDPVNGVFPAYVATYSDGSMSVLGWRKGDNASEIVMLHVSQAGKMMEFAKGDHFFRGRAMERQVASGQYGFVPDHVNELKRPEVVAGDTSGMQASLQFIDDARKMLNGWQTTWPPPKSAILNNLESAISRFNL